VRDAKYLLLKMSVITLMKKKLERILRTEIKFNEVHKKINDKMNATIFKITEKRANDRQNDSLKLAKQVNKL
jgi:hypothetical protein